jgi:hypothetical protein
MPATPRDRRREERAQAAQRWAAYVKKALADADMTAAEVVRKSDGVLETGQLAHWTNEDNAAAAQSALTFARILGLDSDEALRAAGHGALADAYIHPSEAALRARIADLDRQIKDRLKRLGAIHGAEGDAENGSRGAS